MSKFKTVSCNKYHKIIELHIINIFLTKKMFNRHFFLLKNSQNSSYGFLNIQFTQDKRKTKNIGEYATECV